MSQSCGEAPFNFMFLEKLMGEVLGHEGKHQIGSLRVWPEFLSFKKSLSQHFGIGKNRFPCRKRNMRRIPQGQSSLCTAVSHSPLVPMGKGQSSGTGGRSRV